MKQLTILLLPLLLLAACKQEQPATEKKTDDTIPVRVMKIQPGNSNSTITASGRFTTDDETVLAFKTGGVIDHILVREGDAIKAGQLLATLKLTEIDAMVQQATLAAEKAKRDYERVTNLYKDSVATLEQMQNAKTAMDVASQQLETARFNRTYSEIHAPRSGYVLRKMASEGQVAGPGTPVLQVNGATGSGWLLQVGLSDKQWAIVKEHDKATVHTDAGITYEATVLRKAQIADPMTGLFAADLKLAATKPQEIASGMYGKATIQTTALTAGSQWKIPYDALLDADGSMGYVFAVKDDGKTVIRVKVTIAGMETDSVVISEGLEDVTAIVISGSAYLTDNSSISIVQ